MTSFKNHKKAFFYYLVLVAIPLLVFLIFYTNEKMENKRILRIALPNDVRSLDIALSFEKNTSIVVNMIFEGLMSRSATGIPQPAIAKSVDISRDQKHYIFHLRDCTWSDGTDITAHDFEFSLKRSLDPSSKPLTEVPYYFNPIKNATLCLYGKVLVNEVAVHAIDDKTLSIELEYPSPYFLEIVALPYFYPLPKHIVEKDPNWGNNEDIVCNGPFKIKSWKKGNKIEVVKNPNYWDQNHVYLDGINISIIEDSNTALLMYEKGSLDWIGDPFVRLSYDISSQILDREKNGTLAYWFFVNTEKYPLNNKNLRKALSYAINRQAIVDNVFHNSGTPAMSILSPPLSVRLGNCFQDNNVSVAKKLLQKALEELDLLAEDLPKIELRYVAELEMHKRVAQAVQDQLKQVLGLKNIVLRKAEWGVHYDSISQGAFDLGFMGWCISVSDGVFILDSFKNKDDRNNKPRWENSHYKECLDQAKVSLNEIERTRFLREAEDILMDEMPIIPLFFIKQRFAKNPKLKGEVLSDLQFIDFKSAYFED